MNNNVTKKWMQSRLSEKEIGAREKFRQLFNQTYVQGGLDFEGLDNLSLFINRQNLSRILYLHELYLKILNVCGVVIEFGVRWGRDLALFENFHGIYEPYNYNRKIIGFDSFEGFSSLDEKDGDAEIIRENSYGVISGWEDVLKQILNYHESESPISHIRRYELIKGDATITTKEYFENNPHTIVALAYFDFDIYRPTYESLKIVAKHITKGSIIAFDELNDPNFPGEVIALKEVFGLDKYAIKRVPYHGLNAYIVIE